MGRGGELCASVHVCECACVRVCMCASVQVCECACASWKQEKIRSRLKVMKASVRVERER